MLPSDDEAVAAWVSEQLAALDTRPRDRLWRRKVLGCSIGYALSEVPRDVRLDITLPVAEMRVLRRTAESRDLGVREYVRRAIGTVLVVCDGYHPDDIAHLTRGGLIGERR